MMHSTALVTASLRQKQSAIAKRETPNLSKGENGSIFKNSFEHSTTTM
jgi:hypothetical protein